MEWSNRKFQYGDGFFETLIIRNGKISFYTKHIERIEYALQTLKINYSPSLFQQLEKEILDNSQFNQTRVKIQFWRSGKGKYTPEENQLEYSIEYSENNIPFHRIAEKIDICESSEVIPSKFSSFKCFLLPYIVAGIEKTEKQLDDLIILNSKNEISECISSSIFWVKDEVFYTPSLEVGCIDGVMRSQLIEKLKLSNIEIVEGKFNVNELKNVHSIFCSNVTGIAQFKKFREKELEILDLENTLHVF